MSGARNDPWAPRPLVRAATPAETVREVIPTTQSSRELKIWCAQVADWMDTFTAKPPRRDEAAPADDVDDLLACRAELGVAEARADQALCRVVALEQQLGAQQRANDEAKAAWSQLDALNLELRDEVSDLLVRARLIEPAVLHSTADLIKVLRAQRGVHEHGQGPGAA